MAHAPQAFGPDHPDVARSLNGLAELYFAKADYPRVEPLQQRALAIREKAFGPDHPDVAQSLNNLAGFYSWHGDRARAEPLYQRALAIREKTLGPDHPDVAQSLSNLAGFYSRQGDFARAEPLQQRALAIREKALGPDHPDVAASLSSLATLYSSQGDYARVELLDQRALAIREKALGPDHPDFAVSLSSLATLYENKGDYARAKPLQQRALAIREKALGPDHTDVANSLEAMARLYHMERDYARVESLLMRILAIRQRALGSGHIEVAFTLHHLARLYKAKGDYARAEPLCQRDLAIREKMLGPNSVALGPALNSLADVYLAKGDYARAEPLYQRGLAIREKALGSNHLFLVRSLHKLAELHLAYDRLPQAVTAARRAADIQDRNAAAVLATGSEEQKRIYTSTLLRDTNWLTSLHIRYAPANPEAARLALTVLLRHKGRVLDAMTDGLATLRRSLDPRDRDLLARLTAVYSQFATQVSRGPEKASPEQYRKALAALEQARQTLEAEMSARSAAFRAETHLVTVPDVQAEIPDGAVLVEIARYAPFQLRTDSHLDRFGGPRYVAYILRKSGDPAFADLGEAAPLEAAINTLRNALSNPDLSSDPEPAARALDRLLMQPIRKLLGETRWVFLSLDGPLHLVPFGALVDEEGHYLVERYLFSYLTSGRDLLRFGEKNRAPREAPLVLANPAFNESSAPPGPEATHRGVRSIDMVTQSLLSLESTALEAKAIGRLFPNPAEPEP